MPNNIDPLDYEDRLTQAGVPAEQAHVHAETIGQVKAELEALDERARSTRLEEKVDHGFEVLNNKIDTGLAKLDAKIDTGLAGLNTKIDRTKAELEAKLDQAKAELDAKIDRTKADLEARMEKTKWETIRWTIGIVIAICSLQGFIIVNVLR